MLAQTIYAPATIQVVDQHISDYATHETFNRDDAEPAEISWQ